MAEPAVMSETDNANFELMRAEEPIPGAPAPEKAPEPEKPAPAVATVATVAEKPEVKPERLVTIHALHEARAETKEERIKREAAELELAELRRRLPARTPVDDGEIDETQDPIGAIARLKAELKRGRDAEAEQTRVMEQQRDVETRVGARIQAYAAEHPEYPEQVTFLRRARADELRELGMPDNSIRQQIMQEELILGVNALNQDWDLGAKIARLATLRGWKAADPEPAKAAEEKPPADAPRMDRLEKGQKAAVSSSAGGGSGPEAEPTLEAGMKLTGAAFQSWWDKNAERLMR